MKKIIFIISTIIFLMTGIYLAVQFFLSQEAQDVPSYEKEEVEEDTSLNKENISERRIRKILKGKIEDPFINKSGNKILYFQEGNFLSTDLDGSIKTPIGAYPFTSIKGIEWSPDYKKAIINEEGDFYVFDTNNSSAIIFKDNADNLIWGKSEKQLIYKFYDSETKKRSLNISDLSGENWYEITEIPFQFAEIRLNPKKEVAALFSRPESSRETQLFIVDLVSKQKKEIIKKYKGANYKWSPDGINLLFSYTKEDGKSNLAVVNTENEKVIELNFPGLVDKCVWSGDINFIYCANPTFTGNNVLLPEEWSSGKYFSTDTFWKIDLKKGEKKRIVELDEINEDVDAINLFLDEKEDFLFFLDRKTNDLFRISLK